MQIGLWALRGARCGQLCPALMQNVPFGLHHSFRQDARRVALHFGKHYRWIDPATTIEDTEISIACPIPLR